MNYSHLTLIGEGLSDPKARKKATQNSPYCKNTINKIIKEKFLFGNLVDGPSPRSTLSIFDKLSCEQKDKIRLTVSVSKTTFLLILESRLSDLLQNWYSTPIIKSPFQKFECDFSSYQKRET